jgi:RND family efflux transporter MFP subunit
MLKNIFVLLSTFLLFTACQQEQEVANNVAVPVKVFTVKPDLISQFLRLTGSVEAENDAVIYAKVSEKIVKIYKQVGQKVKKDEVIAEQYNEILKQTLEMAKAGLKSAESQFALAKQNYDRMKKLYEQKAVSPQQFDQTESQMQTAEAGLDQARSQLKQAEENYENSFIKAPFDGVVAAINFEENQMVSAGQPAAQVVNSKSMKAKLSVTGVDANKVKLGQPVEIEFPSIQNKIYSGKVVRINEAFNPVTNSLEINRKENVNVVPEIAVQQQTEVIINKKTGVQEPVRKYFVFKIVDGKAKLSEVEVGITSNGRIEVTKGLEQNDQVVIVGQNIVKDGNSVKIIE